MEIHIGMSRAKMADVGLQLHLAASKPAGGHPMGDVRVEVEALDNDGLESRVTLIFSNDDMERPEVADKIFVSVEKEEDY